MSTMTSNDFIAKVLIETGPARAGRLVDILTQRLNISSQAARQRLSRARTPVERYPGHLLPKREAFFYLRDQRNKKCFWDNLLRDLRETGAVYACAIDGLAARGGVVPEDEFAVVSGAPIALKKQVSSEQTARQLFTLGVMWRASGNGAGYSFAADPSAIIRPLEPGQIRARRLAEGVILDGLRQWVWKNGIGSPYKIAIRGEDHPRRVGQFKWDLTGPSYLFPLRRAKSALGFVVADVFAETQLDIHHIQYFIRKVQTYQKTSNSGRLFPILMAEGFTLEALREGHRAGLILTTPENLFGKHVAQALSDLVQTLKDVVTNATVDADSLYKLLEGLSEIEGRAGNLRGILFELITTYIAEREYGGYGGSTEVGVLHIRQRDGRKADLDVVCVTKEAVHVIECKGKKPGGTVSLEEVEKWIGKLPVMQDYTDSQYRELNKTYEFWTSGTFEAKALEKLEFEKSRRKRHPITWKNGTEVCETAANRKLRTIINALNQHFMRHPLAYSTQVAGGQGKATSTNS